MSENSEDVSIIDCVMGKDGQIYRGRFKQVLYQLYVVFTYNDFLILRCKNLHNVCISYLL